MYLQTVVVQVCSGEQGVMEDVKRERNVYI